MEQMHNQSELSGFPNAQFQLTDVLWSLIDNTVAHLNYEDFVVYLLDHNSNVLQQSVAHGLKRLKVNQVFKPMMIPVGQGIVGNVAKSRQPFIAADTRRCEEYIVDIQTGLSEIAVPIIYNEQLIGVIDSESKDVDYYSGYDISVFKELSSIIANTLVASYHQMYLEQLMNEIPKRMGRLSVHQSNYHKKTDNSDQDSLRKLTRSQIRILHELSNNKTSKQIADSLNINFRTVQVHRQNICLRLGASSTGERNTLSLRYKMECKNEISNKNILFRKTESLDVGSLEERRFST